MIFFALYPTWIIVIKKTKKQKNKKKTRKKLPSFQNQKWKKSKTKKKTITTKRFFPTIKKLLRWKRRRVLRWVVCRIEWYLSPFLPYNNCLLHQKTCIKKNVYQRFFFLPSTKPNLNDSARLLVSLFIPPAQPPKPVAISFVFSLERIPPPARPAPASHPEEEAAPPWFAPLVDDAYQKRGERFGGIREVKRR